MVLAPGPPQSDFVPVSGQCPSSASPGWFKCSYLAEVTADNTGTIWTAIGVWATLEIEATFYLDSVTVAIDPLPDRTTTAAEGMAPDAGSGQPPVLMFVFSDQNGWQDLGVVNVLINDALNPGSACYLAYVPPIDILYLVNDTGTGLLPGTTTLANARTLTNSQCTVQPFGVTYGTNGESLTLFLKIGFNSSFSGTKIFFVAARDLQGQNNTGWQKAGTWTNP
jgi:hypothetical protein